MEKRCTQCVLHTHTHTHVTVSKRRNIQRIEVSSIIRYVNVVIEQTCAQSLLMINKYFMHIRVLLVRLPHQWLISTVLLGFSCEYTLTGNNYDSPNLWIYSFLVCTDDPLATLYPHYGRIKARSYIYVIVFIFTSITEKDWYSVFVLREMHIKLKVGDYMVFIVDLWLLWQINCRKTIIER